LLREGTSGERSHKQEFHLYFDGNLTVMRTIGAALFFVAFLTHSAAQSQRALVVISIDGMRPDYVFRADEYKLKIPHLRRIMTEGAHASGVRGVLPTVTYPSHTTILTGVWPAKHGIYSNLTFDPLDKNLAGWYWYSEDIQVPTLWEAAGKAGLATASVSWPVSVGAPVKYLIPEFWRASKSPEDLKLMRAVSTPGLMAEIEKTAGPYINDLDDALPGDRQRTRYAAAILRSKKAQFITVHLAALDHLEHADGPFSPVALAALEELDTRVGELEDAVRANFPDYTICVLSDHGFARTDHTLSLMIPFIEAGFVTVKQGKVTDWKAFPRVDGGSAAIIVKDTKDREAVGKLLHKLAADPANGIEKILEPEEIAKLGGAPNAAFWVDMKINFAVTNMQTGAMAKERKVGGTHGFSPEHPELLASFFIAGPGIRRGADLGIVDMRAVAPTLAGVMGVPFTTGDVPAVAIR
jgi:predicted AlkP superfamily pyrophosphatase or phosphodiesterase